MKTVSCSSCQGAGPIAEMMVCDNKKYCQICFDWKMEKATTTRPRPDWRKIAEKLAKCLLKMTDKGKCDRCACRSFDCINNEMECDCVCHDNVRALTVYNKAVIESIPGKKRTK